MSNYRLSNWRRLVILLVASGGCFRLTQGGCQCECAPTVQLPPQTLPLDELAGKGAEVGATIEGLRASYFTNGERPQLPVANFVPASNLFQLGLNSPTFVGVDGGFGISLPAFFQDMTDVQCRPNLLKSCGDLPLQDPQTGETIVLQEGAALGPTAMALAAAGHTGGPTIGCPGPYALAADAGVCTACQASGDAMGNPTGTFFGINGATGDLFLRFPDAVSAPTFPNMLADLLGAALFNTNLILPGTTPPLSQSFHICGAVSLDHTKVEFDSASGWIRGISMFPVMASFDESLGILSPANSVANNLFFLTFAIDDINIQNLVALPAYIPTGLGSAELSIQVSALMEVAQAQSPLGPFIPSCINGFGLGALNPDEVEVKWPDGSTSGLNNPVVSVSALASNGLIATIGTGGLQSLVQATVTSALIDGIGVGTNAFCVTEAQVLTESPSDGNPTDPAGVANLTKSGGIGGGPVTLAPLPDGSVPSAYLEIAGFVADAGFPDGGDPPDPPGALVTLTAMAAELPPPPGVSPTGDPPALSIPAAGQPYEALGLAYRATPGAVFEEAEIGQAHGPALQSVLFAPVWPDVLGALLVPGVRPTLNEGAIPDGYAAQPLLSSVDRVLLDTNPGLPMALWPIPFGSFQPAASDTFFPLIAVTGAPVGLSTNVPGLPEVPAIIYACADAGPDWNRPVARPGTPLLEGYPVYVSSGGAQVVMPNGLLGLADAGDPPAMGTTRLSDYLPADVRQVFEGPVAVEAFVPLPQRQKVCHGGGDHFDFAWRGPVDDDNQGCTDDPPSVESNVVPSGYFLVRNAAGESLGFGAASHVDDDGLLEALCSGRHVVIQEKASFPLSEFNSCTTCGSPPPRTLPAGDCCWTDRAVIPAVLGMKNLLWDARRDSAAKHLYPVDAGGPQLLGAGVGGWPGDLDASYVIVPVGGNNGDGGFTAQGLVYTEPQQDLLFAIGATDRSLELDSSGAQFTEQPVDVSCVIDAGTFSGPTSSVPTLFLDAPIFPLGSPLTGYCAYMNNPGDWDEAVFQLPTQTEVEIVEGIDAGPDSGVDILPFEAAPPGLLPFGTVIAAGGGQECNFLGIALSTGNQPVYSVNYGLVGDSPNNVPFSLTVLVPANDGGFGGSPSGCAPPTYGRLDAIGYRATSLPVLAPGIVLKRLSDGQSALDAGSAWWASMPVGSTLRMTVDEINRAGFQIGDLPDGGFGIEMLDGGTSCAPAECLTGSFHDACCIPSGGDALFPVGFDESPSSAPDPSCCSGTVDLQFFASPNGVDSTCN